MKPGNDFGHCRASPICGVCESLCASVGELVGRGLTCSLGDLEPPWCQSLGPLEFDHRTERL